MIHSHSTLTVSAAVWQRYPRLACAAPLHPQARTFAIVEADAAVERVAHYSVVDTHAAGAAYYTPVRYSLVPALPEWQLAVLDAVRRLREWRKYSDSPE